MKNPTEFPGQVLAFADRHGMLPAGSTVLCALSGGGDSMALLTCLLALAEARSLTVLAAHYDHQLRGEESQADAAFVADWCRRNRVPLTIGRGDVAAQAAREGTGLEETARAMRYAFLEETARAVGAAAIATAHTADDNAETVLLHLVRGTGLDGLTGIPPRRGLLIRPLLAVTRREIEAYLAAEAVPHREDSSNADLTFARNRIRHQVMPVLRDLNPAFSHRLAANLTHLRADRDYLEDQARQALPLRQEEEGVSLSASDLAALPRPLAVRGVKQAMAALGCHQLSAIHLDRVLALAEGEAPSAQIDLPRGLTVRRTYDRLCFCLDARSAQPLPTVPIPGPGVYEMGTWELEVQETVRQSGTEQEAFAWFLCPRQVDFPLTVRPRRTGDRLRLPGRPEKPLKKWYIEEKIPRRDRDTLPVLTDPRGLVAAAGLGPEASRTAQPGAPALYITLTKTERT